MIRGQGLEDENDLSEVSRSESNTDYQDETSGSAHKGQSCDGNMDFGREVLPCVPQDDNSCESGSQNAKTF